MALKFFCLTDRAWINTVQCLSLDWRIQSFTFLDFVPSFKVNRNYCLEMWWLGNKLWLVNNHIRSFRRVKKYILACMRIKSNVGYCWCFMLVQHWAILNGWRSWTRYRREKAESSFRPTADPVNHFLRPIPKFLEAQQFPEDANKLLHSTIVNYMFSTGAGFLCGAWF